MVKQGLMSSLGNSIRQDCNNITPGRGSFETRTIEIDYQNGGASTEKEGKVLRYSNYSAATMLNSD